MTHNWEVIEVFLMALIVFLEVLHFKERRDLYNRVMAKSLGEYSNHKVEEAKIKIPSKPQKEFVQI